MKIAHCNNCGKNWEDTNPSKDSIEYPIDTFVDGILVFMQTKDEPEEINPVFTGKQLLEIINNCWAHACPICKTDAYLQDNIPTKSEIDI